MSNHNIVNDDKNIIILFIFNFITFQNTFCINGRC